MRFVSYGGEGGGGEGGGKGRGGGVAVQPADTDQHSDKSHHEIRLYASYRAENWSIHIKAITSNVWNHSKIFK